MSLSGDLVGVQEVARRLGVTTRQVRNLTDQGELMLVARGVVDRISLERHLATRQGSRTRAWSETTAWAALAVLSGIEVDWLGQVQKSRLRATLRQIEAPELVSRARNRAHTRRFSGHPSATVRLQREVVTVDADRDLGLVGGAGHFDGYVAAEQLDKLVSRHGLVEDARGQYSLRATGFDLAVVASVAEASAVLAAIDSAEALDARERAVGTDALQQVLESFGN